MVHLTPDALGSWHLNHLVIVILTYSVKYFWHQQHAQLST
jgi:hypothetical protein